MSPRHKKPRHCRCSFTGRAFKPTGVPMLELEQIPLFLDELEAFRLCDMDGLTQEEAGVKMGVSRGTVQRILAAARLKAAMALSQGKAIVFERCPGSPARTSLKARSPGGFRT
jgi:predicted DNA-binding protein (UPF0251 family)